MGQQLITDQLVGGEIGGMLDYRTRILNPAQNHLGLVAVGIATHLNQQHQLGLDVRGNPGNPMFSSPSVGVLSNSNNGGAGAVTATYGDIANLTASDYRLTSIDGANQYQLVRLSDGAVTNIDTGGVSPYTTAEIDGLVLTISSGANAGDSFLLQPTRNAGDSVELLLNDGSELAAAAPLRAQESVDANGNPVNAGSASVTQPIVGSTTGLPLAANISLQFSSDADGSGNPGFVILNGPAAPNNYILYDPLDPGQTAGKDFPDSSNPTQVR